MSRMNDCDSLDDTLGVGADATGPEITRAYSSETSSDAAPTTRPPAAKHAGRPLRLPLCAPPRRNATPPDPARTGASSAWGDRAHNRQGRNPWPR
jgi:hypothetical protein